MTPQEVTATPSRTIRGMPWGDVVGMRINDTTFIAVEQSSRNGNLICLTVNEHSPQHYATGILQDNGGWTNGRYFDYINEAVDDFMERAI